MWVFLSQGLEGKKSTPILVHKRRIMVSKRETVSLIRGSIIHTQHNWQEKEMEEYSTPKQNTIVFCLVICTIPCVIRLCTWKQWISMEEHSQICKLAPLNKGRANEKNNSLNPQLCTKKKKIHLFVK